jgi:GNAT superfamily N-acetyltransferase
MERNSLKHCDEKTFRLVERTRTDADFYTLMGRFFGSRTIANVLGMPIFDDEGRIWCIVLDEAGYPVACSSIEIKKQKATFKSAWVEPDVRRIGLYEWMFETRLVIARQHGIETITSTTTSMSKTTHERYGFRCVGVRGKYFLYRKDLVI